MTHAAKAVLFAFCVAWAGLFIAQKIDLTTADIGRHLKNGESVAAFLAHPSDREKLRVLRFNTYSYTYGDFPVMNHHWGSGLVFFEVQKAFGFDGLSIFFLALLLAGWALMFALAVRRGGWGWAAAWALWLVPVFSGRREVRPEAFSVLLAACFLFLFERYADRKISARGLAVTLTVLQILWTNLHIYFVLGPLFAAVYAAGAYLDAPARAEGKFRTLFIVFACVSAATLANPFGLRGALYPLFIFGNYGYRLIENQSIPFLEHLHILFPHFLYFKTASAAMACTAAIEVLARRRFPRPMTVLGLFFAAAAWHAIRNFQLFALLGLPALSAGCAALTQFEGRLSRCWRGAAIGLGCAAAVVSAVFVYRGHPLKPLPKFGIGLVPGAMRSADFFREEALTGPIFNNYDIGGYLIYALWPDEKVFVDNRPEAYPESFFKNVLVPAQEDEGHWRQLDAENRFNVLFFGYHDLTPWAQTFLIHRIQDPDWAPVFADDYAVIFLRRTVENQPTIVRRELPKSAFRVISGS